MRLHEEGLTATKIADKFGLPRGYVRRVIRHYAALTLVRESDGRQYSPKEQADNCKQAAKDFEKWKTDHLLTCADFPRGTCCPTCHEAELIAIDLRNGDVAYICCSKAYANNLAF